MRRRYCRCLRRCWRRFQSTCRHVDEDQVGSSLLVVRLRGIGKYQRWPYINTAMCHRRKLLTLHMPHWVRGNTSPSRYTDLPGPEEPVLQSIHVSVCNLSHASFSFIGPCSVIVPRVTASYGFELRGLHDIKEHFKHVSTGRSSPSRMRTLTLLPGAI